MEAGLKIPHPPLSFRIDLYSNFHPFLCTHTHQKNQQLFLPDHPSGHFPVSSRFTCSGRRVPRGSAALPVCSAQSLPSWSTHSPQTRTVLIVKPTFVFSFPLQQRRGNVQPVWGVLEVSTVLVFAAALCKRLLPLPPERIIMGSGFLNPLSCFDSFNIYL